VGVLELLLKLGVFGYLYWHHRQAASCYSTVVMFGMASLHLALWIYALTLSLNQELPACHRSDQFFLKGYVYVYGVVALGGALVFLLAALLGAGVTFFTLRSHKP
jgi:hypothetical protein